MDAPHTGPQRLPAGIAVRTATSKGMAVVSPKALPKGCLLECDLLLGARPMAVLARVVECRPAGTATEHLVDLEFLAMAQVDRDSLTDFLQAVGVSALRVREHRED